METKIGIKIDKQNNSIEENIECIFNKIPKEYVELFNITKNITHISIHCPCYINIDCNELVIDLHKNWIALTNNKILVTLFQLGYIHITVF